MWKKGNFYSWMSRWEQSRSFDVTCSFGTFFMVGIIVALVAICFI